MASRKVFVVREPEIPVKPIPGWDELYSAAADGRIWSHARRIMRSNGTTYFKNARWLKLQKHSAGYWYVNLYRSDGTGADKQLVHRLVALAWIPNDVPERDEVNHKDSDRRNARVNNLEWVTSAENKLHALQKDGSFKAGLLRAQAASRKSHRRALTGQQEVDAKAAYAAGTSGRKLAAQYGIHPSSMYVILNNRCYKRQKASHVCAA